MPSGRNAAPGQSTECGRKHAVLRGSHGHLAHHQGPAVERADRRDDHGDRDRARSQAPHMSRAASLNGATEFTSSLPRHDAEHDHGPEHVEQRGDADADDGRAGNGALRVAHVAGRHRRRLEAEVGEHRQRRERRERVEQRFSAGIELGQVFAANVEQSDQGDGGERHELGVCRHLREDAGSLHATQVDQHHEPDRAKGEDQRTGLLYRCSGARFMTAPAKANAIAGSDAQMEIQ